MAYPETKLKKRDQNTKDKQNKQNISFQLCKVCWFANFAYCMRFEVKHPINATYNFNN